MSDIFHFFCNKRLISDFNILSSPHAIDIWLGYKHWAFWLPHSSCLCQSTLLSYKKLRKKMKIIVNKTGVINDPLGQTHSLASSEHCFLLVCFARFEKWGRTDNMCENNDPYRAVTLGWPSGSIRTLARLGTSMSFTELQDREGLICLRQKLKIFFVEKYMLDLHL